MSGHRTWIASAVAAALALTLAACSKEEQAEPQTPANPEAEPQTTTEPEEPEKPAPAKTPSDPIEAALEHPDRPADDKARDADRKPAEVLRFFGIEPGMKVADLLTGSGYYAELLSRIVGPEGTVYAHNNKFINEHFDVAALEARTEKPGLQNIELVSSELSELELPEGELDAVLMILFYHDTYWMGDDRAKMNKAIFDALEPGGVYGVLDHHAEAGSGARDVKSLHRGDAEMIKKEILAAGFELDGESDALRHPEDDRTKSVFDESIRGKTDRFLYRFRKPRP